MNPPKETPQAAYWPRWQLDSLILAEDRPLSALIVTGVTSRGLLEFQRARATVFVLQPGFETLGWAYSGGQL